MKNKGILKGIVLITSLALALGGGYLLGTGRHGHDESDGHKHADEAKTLYTCSMHPFIIRDAPGFCPICGMALVPVKKAAGQTSNTGPADADRTIAIDPVTTQNMGIRTEAVIRKTLRRTIRTVGLITYDEKKQYSINSKIDGWVERLFINQLGQHIKKGQPLMEIYSPELVAAQQEYLLALHNKQQLHDTSFPEIAQSSNRLLDAGRTRLRYWDISSEQIKSLERSGKVRKTLTLYSSYDGIVTAKMVLEGMQVAAGKELLQIADLSTIWINADIYEYELPWVKVGQAAKVELPYAGGRTLDGKITYVFPYLQNDTRTVKARIELPNPGLELKPDMYANILIAGESIDNTLSVPLPAVLNSGNGQTVFVARGEGKFEPRQVKTGLHDESGSVQILSGLDEGERVVVSAQFMLDSESKLREALQKMTEPPQPASQENQPAPKNDKHQLDDLFK